MIKKSRIKCSVISLVLLCSILFTGCSVRIPVITPDDKNVSALVSDYMANISDVSVDFKGSMKFESTSKPEHVVTKTGSISGDIGDVLYGTFSSENVENNKTHNSSVDWYLNSKSDIFYENVDSSDWIGYKDGSKVYDFSWWHDIVADINLKYSGEVSLDGSKVLLLDRTYSGSDLEMLLRHLHISWNADLSQSDMTLSIYADRWTGKPIKIVVSFAESGMPIVVNNDGVNEKLVDFNYTFDFNMSSNDVKLPDIKSDSELIDYVGSAIGATSITSDGLSLGNYQVQFEKDDVFDDVSVEYQSAVIDVKSSLSVTGLPDVHVFVKNGLDAYSVISSDKKSTYDFYKASELSEIVVSDITQFSLDNREAYMYSFYYTDVDNNFNSTSYEMCVALDDNTYVKVFMTSVTDRGVNTMLTDEYANSIISQLSISGGNDNE